jgi:AcrR family transcriptional regulator
MRPEATQTRRHILEAAERVITERGMAACTTRAIAEAAGCAEGSLYRYFPDKYALFHELVHRNFPDLIELLGELPDRAGTGTVRRNLEEVMSGAVGFYQGIIPMTAGVMSERKLMEEQRRFFREAKHGPLRAIHQVAEYVRREQRLGRISERVSPEHAARAALGAAFQHAFMLVLMGEDYEALGTSERFVPEMVRTLLEGLKPRKGLVR